MPRYMTQGVFDGLVITYVMTKVRSSPQLDAMFFETINTYQRSYPDENLQSTLTDLAAASHEIRKIADDIFQSFFEPGRKDRDDVYLAVLKELRAIVMDRSRKKRPLLKRIFGGTRFSYESKPMPDRVQRCRQNISLAGVMILAKQVGAINRELASPHSWHGE